MQRSTATLLLFVAVVAALGLLWAGTFATEPSPGEPTGRDPGPPPTGDPVHPPDPAPGLPVPENAPRVRVTVLAREAFVPPPGPRVQAVDVGGNPLATAPVAGVGAGFEQGSPRPGTALVAVASDGGGSVLRQVAVAETGIARLTVGARVVVRGFVKDERRQPIAGATVWLGEADAAGARRVAASDENGAFELDVPAGTGVPLVVQAEGRASQWLPVAVAAPSPTFTMVLPAAAPIAIQIAGSSRSIEAARAFVVPMAEVTTELAHYPFFLQTLTDGFEVDGNGRAAVSDLPVRGEVGVVVRHPRVLGMSPQSVALRDDGSRVVVPLQQQADEWRGSVVDENGAALAGVAVWARARGRSIATMASLRLLPPHLDAAATCFARSDAAGEFVVGGVDDRDAVVTLRALGRAGRDLAWPLADAAPIVLPAWRGDEVAFRLQPPKAGSAWVAGCDLGGGIRATLAADQPWIVSFPHAGRFDVHVTTFAGAVEVGHAHLADLMVTGTVDLQSPRLP